MFFQGWRTSYGMNDIEAWVLISKFLPRQRLFGVVFPSFLPLNVCNLCETQVNGDQEIFIVSVLCHKKIFRYIFASCKIYYFVSIYQFGIPLAFTFATLCVCTITPISY